MTFQCWIHRRDWWLTWAEEVPAHTNFSKSMKGNHCLLEITPWWILFTNHPLSVQILYNAPLDAARKGFKLQSKQTASWGFNYKFDILTPLPRPARIPWDTLHTHIQELLGALTIPKANNPGWSGGNPRACLSGRGGSSLRGQLPATDTKMLFSPRKLWPQVGKFSRKFRAESADWQEKKPMFIASLNPCLNYI